MFNSEAPTPVVLLAVSVTGKFPASVGVPLITPFVGLKASPGGNPFAVKFNGVLAAVTVKLNGCFKNATALKALVMTAGAFEPPLIPLVGNSRLLGMTCLDWLALYQLKCACAEPPS